VHFTGIGGADLYRKDNKCSAGVEGIGGELFG